MLPFKLRGALKRATFQMDGKNYSFDKSGDLNSGYDVVLWRQSSPTDVDVHYIVAHYSIENRTLTFTSEETYHDVLSVTVSICLSWVSFFYLFIFFYFFIIVLISCDECFG